MTVEELLTELRERKEKLDADAKANIANAQCCEIPSSLFDTYMGRARTRETDAYKVQDMIQSIEALYTQWEANQ